MNLSTPNPGDAGQSAQLAQPNHRLENPSASHVVEPKSSGGPPIDPSLAHAPRVAGSVHQPVSAHGAPRYDGGGLAPSPPSHSRSPRQVTRSPSLARQTLPPFQPTDRSLPARDVSAETIDEAYAQFILYCNPVFPLTVDASELKKIFRQPPKSDGKSFSIWHLYELVRRYEDKEIKTWVELALELGVEKPVLDKGQSTQKVQQYSVRLKRWMRAMHVDAFFDFLRGVPKEYYTHVAPPHDPFPEGGRDGVPAEEDLALRALDPSMRPKRGRRKADEMDDDDSRAMTPDPKRIESAVEPSPSAFAVPQLAYSHEYGHHGHEHDPWTAASALTPASFLAPQSARSLTPYSANPPGTMLRWRVNGLSDTPITPHPLSAMTPASAHPGWDEEPQSAVTPRGKSRRRHGPLVSSAWSSNASSAGGKVRGRPPGNRTLRDGPFTTFPAKPDTRSPGQAEAPSIPVSAGTPLSGLPAPIDTQHHPVGESIVESPIPQSSTSTQPPSSAKRERLQLTVPKRASGPVQLITPPTTGASSTPAVLVNGRDTAMATDDSPPPRRGSVFFGEEAADGGLPSYVTTSGQTTAGAPMARATLARQPAFAVPQTPVVRPPAAVSHEELKRALAHELLRATLTGRKGKRIRGHEAKGLATAILSRVPSTAGNVPLTAWLGVSVEAGPVANSPPRASEGRKIHCHRFRVGDDGYDSPIDDDDADEDKDDASTAAGVDGPRRIRETFDVSWTVSLGSLSGDFHIKGLDIATDEAADARAGSARNGQKSGDARLDAPADPTDWRQRWEEAQLELRSKEEEVRVLRDKVLDAVL